MEINIQNVNMTYPNGKIALKDLNLDLKAPSLIGLLGPNGAGKSTLMKLLVAALMPTGGSILVDGQPLAKTDRLLKARLGYLPQDFGLFDELTVTQFLDYMAALKGISNSKAAIQKTIQAVNLEEKAKSKIRTLSGGQRQRVGIAQALLGNPPFLILTSPRWAWTRKSGFTSAICSPALQKTVWCCFPPISSKMCSRYATRSWSSITEISCSPEHRNS